MAKSGDATKAEKMTENNKANEGSENIDTKVRRIIEESATECLDNEMEAHLMGKAYILAHMSNDNDSYEHFITKIQDLKTPLDLKMKRGMNLDKDDIGAISFLKLVAKVSLGKENVSEKELIDYEIKPGKGIHNPNRMKPGIEVKIHEDPAPEQVVKWLNEYRPSGERVKHIHDDFKKSEICEQEILLEHLEQQAHGKEDKVTEKRLKTFVKEMLRNFKETIIKNLLEPLAACGNDEQRNFMNGEDAERAYTYKTANPYENLGDVIANVAWMKEEIFSDWGLHRRYREASTQFLNNIAKGNYLEDNKTAVKSRFERALGETAYNELFDYNDTDAILDHMKRLRASVETAIMRIKIGNFPTNIFDDEENEDEDKELNKLKNTKEGRKWSEANIHLRKEMLLIENNLQENAAFASYRLMITGNKRVKECGLPGITQNQHRNNKFALNLLKEILKQKPDSLNADQTKKNGTDPDAPLFNYMRLSYTNYELGPLYNKLKNTGHGNEGNYGIGTSIYMFDANTTAYVPYHLTNEWKEFRKYLNKGKDDELNSE